MKVGKVARNRKQKTEEKQEQRIPTTRYQPDYKKGLTSQQVQEHYLHGWTNKAVDPPSKTTKEIVYENVFTYFNLIFVVLAVLLCLVGSFRNLTFLPVIIANTLIGIIQEIRAKQVLDKLTMLNAPKALMERHLKKGTVFISEDEKVYQVSGIISSWEEMFFGVSLPLFMKATFIPFRDVIISDGLVIPYNITIGTNMKKQFRDVYMKAKKTDSVIRSL